MTRFYKSFVNRRTTLKWFGTAVAIGAIPGSVFAKSKPRTGTRYGSDPNLMNPEITWGKIMTDRQLNITALLCDIILPAEADAPAPSKIGIPDFIDEWVSAPYPDQEADNHIILPGLDGIDAAAMVKFGKGFLEITDDQRHEIFETFAVAPVRKQPKNQDLFFYRLRYLTLGAYYTTEVGFKDIGYVGNVAMDSFPGPSEEVLEIFERNMKKIGL